MGISHQQRISHQRCGLTPEGFLKLSLVLAESERPCLPEISTS